MNNKLLSYIAVLSIILQVAVLIMFVVVLTHKGSTALAGVTNYDSLQLQPTSVADFALDVKNSTGTSRFVIDASGNLVASGTNRMASLSIIDGDGSIPLIVGTAGGPSSTRTLAMTEICDNPFMNVGFDTATGTLTLPTAATMVLSTSTCLRTTGDTLGVITLRNASTTGSWTLAPGASSSLGRLNTTSTLGIQLATSTVAAQGFGRLGGTLISSSSVPWLLWSWLVFQ